MFAANTESQAGGRRHQFEDIQATALRERAVILLRNPALTVGDIARRLGYLSDTNFSRTFRLWFGHTPTDIRSGRVPWPEDACGLHSKQSEER
jgi:AraC-like DNA-binding protein